MSLAGYPSKEWGQVLLGLFLLGCLPHQVDAASNILQPHDHPNHYIFLVDASGSTASNHQRGLLYRSALSTAVKLLYKGLSPSIPQFDPSKDLLTLHHFGIVDRGEASSAYFQLRQYRLEKDLIHRRFLRRSNISQEDLISALFPSVFYRLTISHWAEELALDASRPEEIGAISERTFLIKIDDRRPNDGSPEQEEEFIQSWADPVSYREARLRVESIREGYERTKLLDRRLLDGSAGAPIFVAVYEVQSRNRKRWAQRLSRETPFSSATLHWNGETDEGATGTLSTEIMADLPKLLGGSGTIEVKGLDLRGVSPWSPARGPALTMAVERRSRLTCTSNPVEVVLRATPQLADPLLGMSVYEYQGSLVFVAPPPGRCGLPQRMGMLGLWILVGGLVLVAAVAVAVRIFYTPLWAKLPGMSRLVGLSWGTPIEHRSPLAVNPGSQFVRFHLPPFFLQCIAYPGAQLSVGGPTAQALRWSHTTGLDPVCLPVRARTLSLLWKDGTSIGSDWIIISFTTGSRVARLILGRLPATGEIV